MISHVNTVSIYVDDQEKALDFWTGSMGFLVRRSESMGPDARWLEVGPPGAQTCLVLYPRAMMSDWAERKPSVVFQCADIAREHRELSARGVEFLEEPRKMAWGTYARFKDPEGNEFLLRSEA